MSPINYTTPPIEIKYFQKLLHQQYKGKLLPQGKRKKAWFWWIVQDEEDHLIDTLGHWKNFFLLKKWLFAWNLENNLKYFKIHQTLEPTTCYSSITIENFPWWTVKSSAFTIHFCRTKRLLTFCPILYR